MDNLRDAVGRRSSPDYMRSFASGEDGGPELVFMADPTTALSHPGLFDNWSFQRELAHTQSLFSTANLRLDSIAEAEFEVKSLPVLGDSALVSATYTLKLGHSREGAPRRMAGRLEFRMLRDTDGAWKIYRWLDFSLSGEPCWSDLKAWF
jgi:ketosteroid isomerase-like protein